ncbi:alpha/beta hydrolase [Kitasatospora sp. NBC_00458]|uniref:alpha/beta hydrolase n=1 Tax=Kitasatospora sp. NBC_00458 TaxID=2903568 RepID=UPI002E16BCF7
MALIALVFGALTTAGCSSSGTGGAAAASTAPPGPATAAGTVPAAGPARTHGCLTEAQAAAGSLDLPAASGVRPAYFRQADAGPARVAVVLSHQLRGSLCDWVPYLDAFTGAGYAVLASEVPDSPVGDLPTAVKWLETKGIARVVLVGASKGGTGSLVVAAAPGPLPVAAVVSLSGPARFGSDDAVAAVKSSRVPEFFAAEEDDAPFAADARELYAAATAPVRQLKLYPGSGHGADLLKDGALPDVLAFLAANAPAGG